MASIGGIPNPSASERKSKQRARYVEVLNGDLVEVLDNVITYYQSEKLKDATAVS